MHYGVVQALALWCMSWWQGCYSPWQTAADHLQIPESHIMLGLPPYGNRKAGLLEMQNLDDCMGGTSQSVSDA